MDKSNDPLVGTRYFRDQFQPPRSAMWVWRHRKNGAIPEPDAIVNRQNLWKKSTADAALHAITGVGNE